MLVDLCQQLGRRLRHHGAAPTEPGERWHSRLHTKASLHRHMVLPRAPGRRCKRLAQVQRTLCPAPTWDIGRRLASWLKNTDGALPSSPAAAASKACMLSPTVCSSAGGCACERWDQGTAAGGCEAAGWLKKRSPRAGGAGAVTAAAPGCSACACWQGGRASGVGGSEKEPASTHCSGRCTEGASPAGRQAAALETCGGIDSWVPGGWLAGRPKANRCTGRHIGRATAATVRLLASGAVVAVVAAAKVPPRSSR